MRKRDDEFTLYADEDPYQDKVSPWRKVKNVGWGIMVALIFLGIMALMSSVQGQEKKPYNVVPTGYIGIANQILCDEREQVVSILTEWSLHGWEAMWVRYGIYFRQRNEKKEALCELARYVVVYGERTDHFANVQLADGTEMHKFVLKVFMAYDGSQYWMTSDWDVMSRQDYEEYMNQPASVKI